MKYYFFDLDGTLLPMDQDKFLELYMLSLYNYSKEEYKKQFFQSQLVTHVSEAIDNNHLALYYQQVVDVGNNSCDHYFVYCITVNSGGRYPQSSS